MQHSFSFSTGNNMPGQIPAKDLGNTTCTCTSAWHASSLPSATLAQCARYHDELSLPQLAIEWTDKYKSLSIDMLEHKRSNPAEETEFCFLQQYASSPCPTNSSASPVCEAAAAQAATSAADSSAMSPPTVVKSSTPVKRLTASEFDEIGLAAGSNSGPAALTMQRHGQKELASVEQEQQQRHQQQAQGVQQQQQTQQARPQQQQKHQQQSHETSQQQQSHQRHQQQQVQCKQLQQSEHMQHEEPDACSDDHVAKRPRLQQHQIPRTACGKGKLQGGSGLAETHLPDSCRVAASKLQ